MDLSAAFDTIDHGILLDRLNQTFGIQGVALSWFKSYLSNRTQSVCIGGESLSEAHLRFGVPQGSVLGPVLFTMYTQPLADILKSFNMSYHFYADDSQIYKGVELEQLPGLIQSVEECIESVKKWMNSNKLKLNDDKTEVILCGNF